MLCSYTVAKTLEIHPRLQQHDLPRPDEIACLEALKIDSAHNIGSITSDSLTACPLYNKLIHRDIFTQRTILG